MHETWKFNTSTAQKAGVYQSVSKVVQSMRDISPNSGAYFVSGRATSCEITDIPFLERGGYL